MATVVLALAPAAAETVMLQAGKDNSIYSESNNLSNGAGPGLFAGITAMGRTRRALLAFNPAAIPPGSTITSVRLRLSVTLSSTGSQTITLHRVLADWGEGTSSSIPGGRGAGATTGDATWRHRFFNTDQWSNAGGDFIADPSAGAQAGDSGTTATWNSTAALVADVQAWVDAPSSNFGWLLRGHEAGIQTAKRFGSRNLTSSGSRPLLTIEFEPGAGPTATATPPPDGSATPTVTLESTASPTSVATATPSDAITPTATPVDSATVTPTDVVAPSATVTPVDTATATPVATTSGVPTPTGESTPSATATPTAAPCTGDCDGSGTVTINELIVGVNIALGALPLAICPAFDPDGSGTVTINELIAAVNNAAGGCQQARTECRGLRPSAEC